jgi:hypothetical protein
VFLIRFENEPSRPICLGFLRLDCLILAAAESRFADHDPIAPRSGWGDFTIHKV